MLLRLLVLRVEQGNFCIVSFTSTENQAQHASFPQEAYDEEKEDDDVESLLMISWLVLFVGFSLVFLMPVYYTVASFPANHLGVSLV